MILRSARDLQAVPLDRVGEDHRRPVGILTLAAERPEDVREVVTAEIAYQPRRVADEQRCQAGSFVLRQRIEERCPHLLVRGTIERLIGLIRHLVDLRPQQLAALLRDTPLAVDART